MDKSVTGQESTGLHKDNVESQPSLGAINVSLAIFWSQPSKQYIQMSVAAATHQGELSRQVRLPLIDETENIVEVRLPDGTTGYLPPSVIKKSTELCCSGNGIIIQARKFLGLKYLWAGISSYGLDCSGLTFRVYQSQGLSIPRDADEQALEGVSIEKNKLLPGDLLFFATNNGKGEIHHVGIYSGNGMMIHAPNSKSQIKEEPFDAGTYHTEYWGAKRYGLDPKMNIP